MILLTTDTIMALCPCAAWPRERVAAVVGDGLTPAQLAAHKDVHSADRRWALTRYAATLPEGRRLLVRWAAGCAQDVVHLITDEDAHDAALTAICTAVAWTEGHATQEDCRAAGCAASDAAYAASADADTSASAYAASASVVYVAANAASASAYAADASPSCTEQHLLDLVAALETP